MQERLYKIGLYLASNLPAGRQVIQFDTSPPEEEWVNFVGDCGQVIRRENLEIKFINLINIISVIRNAEDGPLRVLT